MKNEKSPHSLETIPGLEWPSGNLSAETMAEIVNESRFKPLRTLIAHQLINEGDALWARLKPSDYDATKRISGISAINFAINEGYNRIGREILYANSYAEEGESFAGSLVRHIEKTSDPSNIGSIKSAFGKLKTDAAQRLTIDPRGYGCIKHIINLMQETYKEGETFGLKEDPQIIGHIAAFTRYRQLYEAAVFSGATADKTGRLKKVSTRVKRAVGGTVWVLKNL